MKIDKKQIIRCLELAKQGMRNVAPNPMVGCVITHQNIVIAVGYHEKYGEAHAEVNAINSVIDKSLLKESTLYVNLEPCAHTGKTPPCSDLIIKHHIPNVVIGCIDSYSEVAGKGVEKLKAAGVNVTVGVLEEKSKDLNKRFFTFHNKKRPYIILKWAETKDGFIDLDRSDQTLDKDNWITTPYSKKLVHKWRSEEQAIMVGTNTAINDNPKLTVRETEGNNPLRIVLDLNLRLPQHLNIFDGSTPTLVYNFIKSEQNDNLEFIKIDKVENLLSQILTDLHNRNILSIVIEGGAQLLQTFIDQNLWDEAKVFIGEKEFKSGLKAPRFDKTPINSLQFDTDILNTYLNA
ncbi:MAG: bifunctional diaminohydroxyphosphoribosylaminopyrimidine deaminase/5-amino-6-(5-phosphoribosylamino)uracil reductase RibD [Vicingaceae bacterium]|nr:bifunctional diaminohydroxyphosphoribosylaminopyrimidine deaminase/5-amino-6-(5-phosphoribosylamino)uracil reductase RibD [Vicingaceae bacterium]